LLTQISNKMNVNVIRINDNTIDIDGVIYEKKSKPESKFKIGNWIVGVDKYPPDHPARIIKIYNNCADLDIKNGDGYVWRSEDTIFWRLATPPEIESYLSKIIEENYVGKNIKCLTSNNIGTVVNEQYMDGYFHSWNYHYENDSFTVAIPHDQWHGCTSNPVVYKEGKWADIIIKKNLPTTKKELHDILVDFYGCDSMNIDEFLKEY
jgi:hypothetical protein